jgi:predicted lipid-binding transport protein (Tim44 family)
MLESRLENRRLIMKMWAALLTISLALMNADAFAAKRFGGGKSVGSQSSNVTQRSATPPAAPANASPAVAAPAAAKPAPAAAAPAAAPARKPWGAMLGGLAAGLGLAWLASSLGMGAAMGQILMFVLLGVVLLGVIGFVMRRRNAGVQSAGLGGSTPPLAYQGVAAGQTPAEPAAARQYSPDHVGNDASARPWERSSMAFDASKLGAGATSGLVIGSALGGNQQGWGVPADFDRAGFLTAAKKNFVVLQDAWDRADMPVLRTMLTDTMVQEIKTQLEEREGISKGQSNKTDVIMLEAQLLGIEDLDTAYMASVEFSGMIREDESAGPSPFREVWNMTKPRDGSTGWLVSGVQALQ